MFSAKALSNLQRKVYLDSRFTATEKVIKVSNLGFTLNASNFLSLNELTNDQTLGDLSSSSGVESQGLASDLKVF